MMNFTYKNNEIEVFSGWDWMEVPYTLEDRRTSESDENWYAMYCGITGKIDDQHHLLENDEKPFYSYYNITGTHNLISPYIYLNESIAINPIVKLGLRIGINQGDNIHIQVNANRSNQWETLETFSNTQKEWFLVEYNLSEYIQSYTRIRIQVEFDDIPEEYYGGVMIDYVSFEEAEFINEISPVLSQYHHLSNSDEIQPYYTSSNSELEPQTFQVAYTDDDGNMPEYVYLEIGDKNYSMINQYGRWNPKKEYNEDYTKEIVYKYTLPILDIVNRSFRFNTFDGKFYNSTPWQPLINFTSGTTQEFPLVRNLSINEMLILESSSTLKSPTLWIPSSDSTFM
ncbi:MAG: hypothetical protein ACTSPA_15980 [Promethearchaeota archaeon]